MNYMPNIPIGRGHNLSAPPRPSVIIRLAAALRNLCGLKRIIPGASYIAPPTARDVLWAKNYSVNQGHWDYHHVQKEARS